VWVLACLYNVKAVKAIVCIYRGDRLADTAHVNVIISDIAAWSSNVLGSYSTTSVLSAVTSLTYRRPAVGDVVFEHVLTVTEVHKGIWFLQTGINELSIIHEKLLY